MATAPKKTSSEKPPEKAGAKKKSHKNVQTKNKRSTPASAQLLGKWTKRLAYTIGGCALLFFLVTVVWAGSLRYYNPPFTPLMLIRHFEQEYPIDKVWRDYENISPHLLLAVLAAEDQRFYEHHGFDLKEIQNAIEDASEDGRLRGASTISQQTAKNVFLWPARSWWRKGGEAYFTVLIEALWPKRRILEVYVNIAEMGPGIYGVESAAQHYYDCSASELNPQQAALLASTLPSPLARNPNAPPDYMTERQDWILTQMNNLGGTSFLK